MPTTNFPNGISSYGMPVLPGGIPPTTGKVFFVHSGTGSSGNDGLSPIAPLATIDQAVNKCTASQGDVIVVMPGHAETISSATSLVVDVAGISIIGLGIGRNKPILTFSATASKIPISADNVLIRGLVFMASVASIVTGVEVTGDYVTLDSCEWDLDETGVEFLVLLDLDTAVGAMVVNCRLEAENIAGTNTGIRIDVSHYARIINCELRGDFTTAAISGTAGSAAASTDVLIADCLIENLDTTAGVVIDAHDNGTGIITRNQCFTLFATAPETALDPGNMLCTETYVVNAVDESGTIVPVTLST